VKKKGKKSWARKSREILCVCDLKWLLILPVSVYSYILVFCTLPTSRSSRNDADFLCMGDDVDMQDTVGRIAWLTLDMGVAWDRGGETLHTREKGRGQDPGWTFFLVGDSRL